MNEAAFLFLSSREGQSVLERLSSADLSEAQTLARLSELRRDLPADLAGAALTVARLRRRGLDKFSRAEAMYFTPDGLEQSSGEIVSRWRARRLAGYARIADLGCGIGGDTIALASIPGAAVIGLDIDPLRLRLARANSAAYGLSPKFVAADLLDPLPLCGISAAFFDPARREAGRRVFSVRDYLPPLDRITAWDFDTLAVKLSPGVNLDELRPYTSKGAGVEFVSLDGDLKEAVLWNGASGFAGCWASRLERDGTGETLASLDILAPPVAEPLAYLYEPDPAVIRAGLLGELSVRLGIAAYRIDETIAYLTSDSVVASKWARVWPIWDWMPFQLKRLRAALRARGVGQVTVKKRGSPIAPEDLIRQLKLGGGGESAVVVLTHVAGKPAALICGEMLVQR